MTTTTTATATEPTAGPADRPGHGRAWKRLLVALAAGGLAAAATVALTAPAATDLPSLGQVPAFSMTAETNRPFGSDDLRDKVWIANFIFTRCPTVCPVFSMKMAEIQARTADLGAQLMLVSFSVDPDWDTPARLAEYGAKFGAEPTRWRFLTGLPETVRLTVRDGMKVSMEQEGLIGDVPNIIHGTHFVLVDRTGQIRGYYESNDPDRIRQLVEDARDLTNVSAAQ